LKTVVTFRLDPAVLDGARRKARLENRTLTNFVETVLKTAVEEFLSGSVQTTDQNRAAPPHPDLHPLRSEQPLD